MHTIIDVAVTSRRNVRRHGRHRMAGCLAAASITLIALTGCASSGGGAYGSGASQAPAAASSAALGTASTTLGTVVVDGRGMTVYVFDRDTANSGKSACTGACAGLWPAVTSAAAHPSVKGVTGTVGTIPAAGGKRQVTLDGLPLYTYSGDSAAGDVKGQGLQGIWWVVSPAGKKVTASGGSGY